MRDLTTTNGEYRIREFYDIEIGMNGSDIYDENGAHVLSLYGNEFALNDYIKDEELYEEDDNDIKAYDEEAIIVDLDYTIKSFGIVR